MKKFVLLMALSMGISSFGQIARMEIPSRPDEKSVSLTEMDVKVEIFGNIAKTVTTLQFSNSSGRNLEGNLVFPLPDKTTVSGYAIDINGKMREAVPVTKARATEVFESIQKQNVDPGIIEKVEGNNFRTRISPIPARGSRTIQITYFQELKLNKDAYQYHLPLDLSTTINKFSLTTKVFDATSRPQLVESPDGSFSFSQNSNVYEASMNKTDFKTSKSLIINLPKRENKVESFVQKNEDGSGYFYANVLLDAPFEQKKWSNKIGIIWDNSLSGLKRDHKKELELLDKVMAKVQNATIDVTLLNINADKGKTFSISNGNWSSLRQYLENINYDGGTDYSKLQGINWNSDEYLMFSDGISSFGPTIFSSRKPIYTIASSPTSNFGILQLVAQQSHAKFINLTDTSVEDAFNKMDRNYLQFLGIINNIAGEVYPVEGTEVQRDFSVAGITKYTTGKLVMMFGRNGKVTIQKEIDLSKASNVLDISKVWAQNKVAYMELNPEQNKKDIEEIGQQFGIVTSNTSLMVLENVSDYVKYQITPPTELLAQYNEMVKQGQVQREQRKSDLLKDAIARAKELQEWWKKDFTPVKPKYPKPLSGRGSGVRVENTRVPVSNPMVHAEASANMISADAITEASVDRRAMKSLSGYADDKEVSTAMGIKKKEDNRNVPEIKMMEIKSDKDYIKLMESSKNPYQTYLDLRETYQSTPGYYFDMAQYFFNKKDKKTGLLILSSLADLGIEDAELYKMLAYKLKEIEAYDDEVFITKKVTVWRPFDAQSYRDYALALQDAGQYQAALDNLYKVLTNDYPVEFARRDRDITEIIVPEINNLVALHRKDLNLSKIDKGILVDIPVDIRVVMNWNKDMTDIDLWVTDPNGEKCYYGNRTTSSGGRISQDVTQGFGPEQFMLKKAIPGKYKIQTNFFGERQMSITGPTTISVEIFLMYSSGKQVRKMITFQNNKPDRGSDGINIGEFEF